MIHYSERMLQGCCSSVQYLDNPADDSVVPFSLYLAWHGFLKSRWWESCTPDCTPCISLNQYSALAAWCNSKLAFKLVLEYLNEWMPRSIYPFWTVSMHSLHWNSICRAQEPRAQGPAPPSKTVSLNIPGAPPVSEPTTRDQWWSHSAIRREINMKGKRFEFEFSFFQKLM